MSTMANDCCRVAVAKGNYESNVLRVNSSQAKKVGSYPNEHQENAQTDSKREIPLTVSPQAVASGVKPGKMGMFGKGLVGVLDSQNKPSNTRELFICRSSAAAMFHVQMLLVQ